MSLTDVKTYTFRTPRNTKPSEPADTWLYVRCRHAAWFLML